MLKTQYDDLFITIRISIQDPSIRPPGGNRNNTFGEAVFWVGMMMDMKDSSQQKMRGHSGSSRKNDTLMRKVSGRNLRFGKRNGKGKSRSKKGGHRRGRQGPCGQRTGRSLPPGIWGKVKARRERKRPEQFQHPSDENKGSPFYDNGKGKGGKEKGRITGFLTRTTNSSLVYISLRKALLTIRS